MPENRNIQGYPTILSENGQKTANILWLNCVFWVTHRCILGKLSVN